MIINVYSVCIAGDEAKVWNSDTTSVYIDNQRPSCGQRSVGLFVCLFVSIYSHHSASFTAWMLLVADFLMVSKG